MLLASLLPMQKQMLLVQYGQRGGFGSLSCSNYDRQVEGCPTDTPDCTGLCTSISLFHFPPFHHSLPLPWSPPQHLPNYFFSSLLHVFLHPSQICQFCYHYIDNLGLLWSKCYLHALQGVTPPKVSRTPPQLSVKLGLLFHFSQDSPLTTCETQPSCAALSVTSVIFSHS